MVISKEVTKRIDKKEAGSIITYEEFETLSNFNAVALTLNRLNRDGVIIRLSKGLYYKPKVTKYGNIGPSDDEILKALIEIKKQGYVSGLASFNKLGLTTQVPNTIEIAGNQSARTIKLGKLRIKYRKTNPIVSKKTDVELVQLLDAIQNLKKIPDASLENVLLELKERILNLKDEQISRMTKLAKKCRPVVRAVLGAIIEKKYQIMANDLKSSLNSLTSYKLKISENILPNKKRWNIK